MTIPALTEAELDHVFRLKYESSGELGSTPATYKRFHYHSPEDYYEALVGRCVSSETVWLDVGCGRSLFPSNPEFARELAGRCQRLVGVDPDSTILENPIVHEPVQASVYDYRPDFKFDLITLRMVAEHIDDPSALLDTLMAVTHSGSMVIIYTVNSWSPVPILTRITPLSLRHPLKKFLWHTEEKDTFPTAYRMNTRRRLHELFRAKGFEEAFFEHLDDCRTLSRFRPLLAAELSLRAVLRRLSLRYPENCVLGAYRRV